MDIVIHHNPDCGTSRNVLAIIEAAGYAPTVIEYLKTRMDQTSAAGPVRGRGSDAAHRASGDQVALLQTSAF